MDEVSDVFEAKRWREVGLEGLSDVTYHRGVLADGSPAPVVRIAFNRPEVRNAFRPQTVDQLYRCLDHARMTASVATILLTGNGPSEKDGGWAFCSGGDQRIRGRSGYRYATEHAHDDATADESTVDTAREKQVLEKMLATGNAPWKKWED